MSAKKRQHYVDQELQRNFLKPGEDKLWVYDRVTKQYRNQYPSDIAVEGHLYSLVTPELKEQRYIIEDALEQLQRRALPALMKLRLGERISQRERFDVCEYVGFQVVRTPEHLVITQALSQRVAQFTYEEMVKDMIAMPPAEYEAMMVNYEAKADLSHHIAQSEWQDVLDDKRLTTKQPPDYHLGMMIESGTDIAIGFSMKRWVVLHAKPGRGFIGSDVPVIQMPMAGSRTFQTLGPLSPGTANYFPFAEDTALLILPQDAPVIDHASVKDKGRHTFNRNIALDCRRIIFSGSQQLLEATVARSGLDHIKTKILYDDELIREQMRQIINEHKSADRG